MVLCVYTCKYEREKSTLDAKVSRVETIAEWIWQKRIFFVVLDVIVCFNYVVVLVASYTLCTRLFEGLFSYCVINIIPFIQEKKMGLVSSATFSTHH